MHSRFKPHQPNVISGRLTTSRSLLSIFSSDLTTSQLFPSLTTIYISPSLHTTTTMAMIYQLLRGNSQSLPYFVIEPLNSRPHRADCLTPGYVYPCSSHCRGLSVPWQTAQAGGHATAVVPMILLDLAQQLAQDVNTLPHLNVGPVLTFSPDSRVLFNTT